MGLYLKVVIPDILIVYYRNDLKFEESRMIFYDNRMAFLFKYIIFELHMNKTGSKKNV
jgi:hypothetical protein